MAEVFSRSLVQEYLIQAEEAIQVYTDTIRQAQANLQASLGARQVLQDLLARPTVEFETVAGETT